MRQPHKNLFFSYRGSRPNDLSDMLLDKQLEDNVTKALIYVLENSDRERVLSPFLRIAAQLRTRVPLNEVQFALQRADIARPRLRERVALAIAPNPVIDSVKNGSRQAGRPDAWIWADERFAILVETKVRGSASLDQMLRHVRGAEGWNRAHTRIVSISWGRVYDAFTEMRRSCQRADVTTRLLLDEFVRYLRMTALASDTTFDLDDFGYFLLQPSERDSATRALLLRKLVRFTEELTRAPALRRIVKEYDPSGKQVANYISPGVFRRAGENYWITIGPKERRSRCHFTIRLTEDGISLEVFSPHKSFTRKLVSKIERDPNRLIASLRTIGREEPYAIRLREAYFHDPNSSYKGQRIDRKVDYLEVHPKLIAIDNVKELILDPLKERLRYRHLRPEIFLFRHFRLSEVVGNSKIVQDVAHAAESMLGYFTFALDV